MTTLPLLREVLSPALVRALGYALLHSLWQGAVLALVLAGVLPLLRRQRAELRYTVAAGALAMLALAVAGTFGFYYQQAPVVQPVAVSLVVRPGAAAIVRNSSYSEYSTQSLGQAAAPTAVSARLAPAAWLRVAGHRCEPYLPVLVAAWLLGLLLMGGRLLGGLLYAGRLRRTGTRALGADWQQRLTALAHRAGLRRPVALLESARVAGPLVLGHLRPVVLLPLGAVAGLSPALLEALLAHEVAHIARRDYLLNLGLAVVEVLFFYHPAVWFMANCLRAERENCCDDQAAALCGGDRLRVARALAALAELEAATVAAPRLALAATGTGGRGSLLARVRRLALGRPQAPTVGEGLLAGLLTLLGLLGLSTGVVLAASPERATASLGKRQTAPASPVASPVDTTRRKVAASAPPAVPAPPPVPGDTVRHTEKIVRVERNDDHDDQADDQPRRFRQGPPRRGASTVVLEKDKKGRVVSLLVDGQPVETTAPGKKAKHGKVAKTVEVVRVPDPRDGLTRLERPMRPERLEQPENQSFSFNFSADGVARQALESARRSLRETLRNPDLTADQRQQMEQELRKLDKSSARLRWSDNGREFKEFHFNLNSAAASHVDPRVHIEFRKRGDLYHLRADGQGNLAGDDDAHRAEREAERAERDANRAEADARRAELRARIAAAEAELRALDGPAARSPRAPQPPRPPRAPLAPLAPFSPQGPPPPPAPPAPKTGELRDALRHDGLIGQHDRSFSFQLNDKGGRVNGKALTPAQVERYRKLLNQPAGSKGKSSTYNINIDEN
ncbi:M56 family metallopeptidase [Hymenobacter baengnokdamensis]|uniref:M56 family metallopeptidase n=1 Tax=Hymenobacter baengnokdamensis TaxID=2615203 RepID=UPI0012488DA3|nr:M56 family metallopeptidase [Hymenobacter baengnokdamensis]